MGLFSYILQYEDEDKLKVDFNYYPFPRIEKGKSINSLSIDSIHDIAANKVHTLFMNPRSRDYIDLFCILNQKGFTLNQLIMDAKAKFDWHIDKINLASQFLGASDIEDFPKMLIPFDKSEMISFFDDLANQLKHEVLR